MHFVSYFYLLNIIHYLLLDTRVYIQNDGIYMCITNAHANTLLIKHNQKDALTITLVD